MGEHYWLRVLAFESNRVPVGERPLRDNKVTTFAIFVLFAVKNHDPTAKITEKRKEMQGNPLPHARLFPRRISPLEMARTPF